MTSQKMACLKKLRKETQEKTSNNTKHYNMESHPFTARHLQKQGDVCQVHEVETTSERTLMGLRTPFQGSVFPNIEKTWIACTFA